MLRLRSRPFCLNRRTARSVNEQAARPSFLVGSSERSVILLTNHDLFARMFSERNATFFRKRRRLQKQPSCYLSLMKPIRFVHRGIAYTVVLSEKPDRWTWHFSIGEKVKSGKVTAKLDVYAQRLVQQRIDQELRRSAKVQSAAE
jgi:hypothetical protein